MYNHVPDLSLSGINPVFNMIRLLLSVAYISWLTLLAPQLGAQSRQPTLGELWYDVERSYSGITASEAAITSALSNERAVKSEALPQARIQLQNTFSTYDGRNGAFFPQPGFFNVSGNMLHTGEASVIANTFASATIEWELFAFGKQHKRKLAASEMSARYSLEKEAYVLRLKKEFSVRYIKLLYTESKRIWAAKNARRLGEIGVTAASLARAGIKPEADSLLARSSYLQAMAEQDKWLGNRNASLEKFREFYRNAKPDLLFSERRFAHPPLMENERVRMDKMHPFTEVLRKESSYYKIKGTAETRSGLPSVKFLGGFAYRGSGIDADGNVSGKWADGFSDTADNFIVGIGITWDLTGMRTYREKGRMWNYKAREHQMLQQQAEEALRAGYAATLSKRTEQQKQLRKTEQALKNAGQAYEMYMARYRSGLISLTELLQIRMLLEQAENSHIEAVQEYWMQVAEQAELTADFDFLFNSL